MAHPAKTDRNSILAAAMELVEEYGVEDLAIRAVAVKLGLAPNALYHYFPNLAALKASLAEEARLRMLALMQKAAGRKQPAQAVQAISETYLRFALEHSRVFDLYLRTAGSADGNPQCTKNVQFFLEIVGRVYGEARAWDASHALWALLHGIAVLREAGVLGKTQASSALKFGLTMWIEAADREP